MTHQTDIPAYADPNHKGNKLRPRIRCIGCGTKGCITAWGPWCFECNVKRMTRLDGRFAQIAALGDGEDQKR